MELTYEIQLSQNRTAVWIHSSDGSTIARFGKMGIDLHNTVTEQMAGKPECRLCTHGKPSEKDWQMFIQKSFEWWGVVVPYDAFASEYLKVGE